MEDHLNWDKINAAYREMDDDPTLPGYHSWYKRPEPVAPDKSHHSGYEHTDSAALEDGYHSERGLSNTTVLEDSGYKHPDPVASEEGYHSGSKHSNPVAPEKKNPDSEKELCGVCMSTECPDSGEGEDTDDWVCCDGENCGQWFHTECLAMKVPKSNEKWMCYLCDKNWYLKVPLWHEEQERGRRNDNYHIEEGDRPWIPYQHGKQWKEFQERDIEWELLQERGFDLERLQERDFEREKSEGHRGEEYSSARSERKRARVERNGYKPKGERNQDIVAEEESEWEDGKKGCRVQKINPRTSKDRKRRCDYDSESERGRPRKKAGGLNPIAPRRSRRSLAPAQIPAIVQSSARPSEALEKKEGREPGKNKHNTRASVDRKRRSGEDHEIQSGKHRTKRARGADSLTPHQSGRRLAPTRIPGIVPSSAQPSEALERNEGRASGKTPYTTRKKESRKRRRGEDEKDDDKERNKVKKRGAVLENESTKEGRSHLVEREQQGVGVENKPTKEVENQVVERKQQGVRRNQDAAKEAENQTARGGKRGEGEPAAVIRHPDNPRLILVGWGPMKSCVVDTKKFLRGE